MHTRYISFGASTLNSTAAIFLHISNILSIRYTEINLRKKLRQSGSDRSRFLRS